MELYNLVEDPGENTNLAEAEPGVVEFLKARMDAYIAKRLSRNRLSSIRSTNRVIGTAKKASARSRHRQQAYNTLHINERQPKLQAEERK
ncbi:MAG: hypothetical protein R2856_32330 [Caldilineaceae bacterium]